MRRFGLGMLSGLAAVFGSLFAIGVALASFAPGSMPAPAISSLVHIDEKLRFFRRNADVKPTVLAVGSSVTWRQLAGKAFSAAAGGDREFLNGGTAYLQIHQTQAMAEFLLDHYSSVKALLVMVSVPDFRNCSSEPAYLFAPRDAARYAFGDWPVAYFYLHYVSPMRYLRTALSLADRRAPLRGDLYFDDFGSGPVQIPPDKLPGLRYGKIDHDESCVAALDEFVGNMKARDIRMHLVFTPIHPSYRSEYPEEVAKLSAVAERFERKADRTHLMVMNLIDDPTFARRDFYDAFHLQWDSVQTLSTSISGSLQKSRSMTRREETAEEDLVGQIYRREQDGG